MSKSKFVGVLVCLSVMFLLIIGCATFSTQNGNIPSTKHEGKWVGTDNQGHPIKLILKRDGTGDLFINNQSVKREMNATNCLYVISYAETPIGLELAFIPKGSDAKQIVFLLDFLGPKMMRVWSNFDATLPKIDVSQAFVMKRTF